MNNILDYYKSILDKNHLSPASYFEWNTFRVFDKLGGFINLIPNFKLSSDGKPTGCAKPGVEDILVEYEEFKLLIECSLRSGETQVDYEGNSVTRHLNSQKKVSNKQCFTLFIAPSIDINLYKYYSINKPSTPVIPLTLNQFILLINYINIDFNSSKLQKILLELLKPEFSSKDFSTWTKFIDNYIKSLNILK